MSLILYILPNQLNNRFNLINHPLPLLLLLPIIHYLIINLLINITLINILIHLFILRILKQPSPPTLIPPSTPAFIHPLTSLINSRTIYQYLLITIIIYHHHLIITNITFIFPTTHCHLPFQLINPFLFSISLFTHTH